jgi:predicted naringenin-chalcone synthase
MFLTGVGTATPERRYTQLEAWDIARDSDTLRSLKPRSRYLLEKVLTGNNGIDARYLALDAITDAFAMDPDTLQARFQVHAPALATRAARHALNEAGVEPRAIDALLISTCTGYLCPGLTSYVSENLGLRADAHLLDLVGQGCGAALPNLRTAESFLGAGQASHTLTVCVEVSSAAMYLDDDPGVLISACLFGDGAAAVVASNDPAPNRRRVRWHDALSFLEPAARDTLRFEQCGGMLRNRLTRDVPTRAARHAAALLDRLLPAHGLGRSDIGAWVMHAGGRDVLLALSEAIRLSEADLALSAAVLREYGNMSSASVLFVLATALASQAPGGWWWMSSFGAGFSCHGALLQVE